MKKEIKITLTENDIHTAYNKLLLKYAVLEKETAELKEKIRLMNEQEARDIRTKIPMLSEAGK